MSLTNDPVKKFPPLTLGGDELAIKSQPAQGTDAPEVSNVIPAPAGSLVAAPARETPADDAAPAEPADSLTIEHPL